MTIEELLQIREAVINKWKIASESIFAIKEEFSKIRGTEFHMLDHRKPPRDGYLEPYPNFDDIYTGYPHDLEQQIRSLDFSLWKFLLDKLSISRILTGKDKNDFYASIRNSGLKFCREEIDSLSANLNDLANRSAIKTIRSVYRQLIGTTYNGIVNGKRDNLQKVENLFRISGTNFVYGDRYIHSSGRFDWNDLIIACKLIEGKSIDKTPDFWQYFHKRDKKNNPNQVDCFYFHLTTYKNGNVRCKWNPEKQNILDKLNLIGSGDWNNLPDSMRKRYKPEHFGQEHNKLDYNKVFSVYESRIEPVEDKDFAFFPTPDHVADQMIEIANFDQLKNVHEIRVLEPSAGDGAIIKRLKPAKNISLRLIEYNTYRVEKLKKYFREKRDLYAEVRIDEEDFLNYWQVRDDNYHRILMNPPFGNKVEMYHVVRAFNFLAPSGICVAIVPMGALTNDDSKSKVFQEFLKKYQYQEPVILESGTFKKTGVKTAIISLIKPFMED